MVIYNVHFDMCHVSSISKPVGPGLLFYLMQCNSCIESLYIVLYNQ